MTQRSPASASSSNPFRRHKLNELLGLDNSSFITTSDSLANAVARSETGTRVAVARKSLIPS